MDKSLNSKFWESVTDALIAASKRAIQKTSETTGGLVGNKCAERFTRADLKNIAKNACKSATPAQTDET